MIITGTILKYEDEDINTDVIWPGKYTYIHISNEDMPKYAMETFDPSFRTKINGPTILAVGKNFGCGSSREQASLCLKYSGIKAVIAPSFSRIFYRNSINIGLVLIESIDAFNRVQQGDNVHIDLNLGILVINKVNKISITTYPPFVMDIIKDDGLINHIKKQKVK